MRRLHRRSVLVTLVGLLTATQTSKAATSPAELFNTAVAAWHFSDGTDQAGADSRLAVRGTVKLGVELSENDRAASLERGGDGRVAQMSGDGWLDAGQGANDELQLKGESLTVLLRLKCPSGIWETRGLFSKGGGHDKLVINLFSHDFGNGPEIGFELGIAGKPGLGGQVRASIDRIGPKDWHDIIARYDGKELRLFVDGVLLDQKPASGSLRQENPEPLSLGAGTAGENVDPPFSGEMDHAAVWDRALASEEIVLLSGGREQVARRTELYANWKQPSRSSQPGVGELITYARQLQSKLQHDPQRPQWHFLAPEEGDCMPFDPNGAIFWKGRYHLFYIFQRQQAEPPHTVHCWGHASSIDLVHWTHHPTGLDVAPEDPDRGIFSGNAFLDRAGVPTIMYHGVNVGNCIATSTDDLLLTWKKSAHNPIVPIPKPGQPGHGQFESWDPHGWFERGPSNDSPGKYFAIFGGAKGALMSGPELHELTYQRPILEKDPWAEPGEDLSCPDFFPIGDKHMLLCISHRRGARYYLGRWENEQFTPESHERMNWPGGAFFAPETMLDGQGRRLLWGWAFDPRSHAARNAGGWSGVMSMPRVLSLGSDGVLQIDPIPELERQRLNPVHLRYTLLEADKELVLKEVHGDSLELELQFEPGLANDVQSVGVKVRRAPDSSEETLIEFLPSKQQLRIDFSRSSLDPSIRYKTWFFHQPNDAAEVHQRATSQSAPLTLSADEPLRLRVFLDRSMLEVFANGRQCLTQRLFPTRADSLGVSLVSRGGPARVKSIQAWELAGAR